MLTLTIDGITVATEPTVCAADAADAMRDALLALTYGGDAQLQFTVGYDCHGACALMVDMGLSAQYLFCGENECPETVRSAQVAA